MAKVTFETAALADAIKRANTVAPTRGKNLDLYKGFYFEVSPDDSGVFLRSTNGDIFYQEWLMPLKIEGDYEEWRLPSPSVNGIVSNLPFGMGKTVLFDNEDGRRMRITSDRMRASVPMMIAESFPDWEDFDDTDLEVITQFGSKLDMAAWAAANTGIPPLCGIYIDKEKIVATDRARLATVEFQLNIPSERQNIVVPISALSGMIRTFEEIKIGVEDNHLLLAPSEDVHIKCNLFADEYPPINKVLDYTFNDAVMFDKDIVTQILSRIKTIGNTDRQAMMEIRIGEEQILFFMQDTTSGEEIEESAYLAGQCPHEPLVIGFNLENFLSAVTNSPAKTMILNYNAVPLKSHEPIRLDGGADYKIVLMPRVLGKK